VRPFRQGPVVGNREGKKGGEGKWNTGDEKVDYLSKKMLLPSRGVGLICTEGGGEKKDTGKKRSEKNDVVRPPGKEGCNSPRQRKRKNGKGTREGPISTRTAFQKKGKKKKGSRGKKRKRGGGHTKKGK